MSTIPAPAARRALGRASRLVAIALAMALADRPGPAAAQSPQAWRLESFEVVWTEERVETKREVIPAASTRDFDWGGRKEYTAYPFGTLEARGQLKVKLPDQIVPGQSFDVGATATGTVGTPGRQGLHAAIMTIAHECYLPEVCPGGLKSQYLDDVAGKSVDLTAEIPPQKATVPTDESKWPPSTTLIFRGGIGTTTPGDPYWRVVVYAYYKRPDSAPNYRMELDAQAERLPPSGSKVSETEVTATVLDPQDKPQAGDLVQFSLDPPDMGRLSAASAVTGADGKARVKYTAPRVAEMAGRGGVRVVAKVPSRSLERGLSLGIETYRLALTVDPPEVPVEAVWRAIKVRAEVTDFEGRPAAGDIVELRADPPDLGEFIGVAGRRGVTDGAGRVEAFFEPVAASKLLGRDRVTLYATNLSHGGEQGALLRFLALRLIRTWPLEGARNVELASGDSIDLEFDRPVDPASVTAGSVRVETLWHGGLGAAPESFGPSINLRLRQDPLPDVGLRVSVRLLGGEGGVRGRDGSLLLGDQTLRFRTVPKLTPKIIVSQVVDDPQDLLLGGVALAPEPFTVRVEAGIDEDSELDDTPVEVKLTGPLTSDAASLTQAFFPGRWPPKVPLAALRRGNSANFAVRQLPPAAASYTFEAELRPVGASDDARAKAAPVTVALRRWDNPNAATRVGVMGVPLITEDIPPFAWKVSRGQTEAWWAGLGDPAAEMMPLAGFSLRLGYLADVTCLDTEKCTRTAPWTHYAYWARHLGRTGFFTRGFQHIVGLVPPGFFDRVAEDPDARAHPRAYHGAAESGIWSERSFEEGRPTGSAWPVSLLEVGSPPETLVHVMGDALGLAHTTGRWDALAGYDMRRDLVIRSEADDWTGAFRAVMNEAVGAVPSWPSVADYNGLLDHYTKRRGFQPPLARAAQTLGPQQEAPRAALLVSGAIRRGDDGALTAQIDPLASGPAVPSAASPGGGDYALELRGEGGGLLSRYAFSPAFGPLAAPGAGPGAQGGLASFLLTVPAEAGLASLALVHGGADLAVRLRSANPPAPAFLRPAPGSRHAGDIELEWAGGDADGDALTYSLLASGDAGASWLPLVIDGAVTRFTLPSAQLPRGSEARLRLVASDGFDSAEAALSLVLEGPQEVLSTVPADGASQVPPRTRVRVQLRDPLDPATLAAGDLALIDPAGAYVPGASSYDPLSVSLVFTPTAALRPATLYEARLGRGPKTFDGRALAAEHRWQFRTEAERAFLPSLAQVGNVRPVTRTPVATRTLGPTPTAPSGSPTAPPPLTATFTAGPPTATPAEPSATPDVIATAVAATLTALAPSPTVPGPTASPSPGATAPSASVTALGATLTGADPQQSRMAFAPGEAIILWLRAQSSGAGPLATAFDFQVLDQDGGAVPELSWQGSVDVPPGANWFKLERSVPARAAGPYTFRGTVTYGGQSSSATSELYLARQLRIADDFGNSAGGWPAGQDAHGTFGYLGGEYRFLFGAEAAFRWAAPPNAPSLSSLAVEADARMPAGTEGNVALVFGLNNAGTDFHIYEVTRDGRYALYRMFGGQWQTLLSPQPSPALRIGDQPNHLLLVRESGLTRLFANGQEVSLVTDIAAPAGRSGIYASTGVGGLEARFDNFRLYDLP